MSKSKMCGKCGEVKSVNEFSPGNGAEKRTTWCKPCRATYRKEKYIYKNPGQVMDGKKMCSNCKQIKSTDDFHTSKHNKSGFASRCKECKKEYEIILAAKTNYTVSVEIKTCIKCGITKDAAKFSKNKLVSDGLHSYCKSCRTAHGVKYNKVRLTKDDLFKLKHMLYKRLRDAIKGNFKAGSAVRDLGCSIEYFKEYISLKFVEGMTWENRGNGDGKWHLDHIIPLASFDLTDRSAFLKAAHYTNYQPLWSHDNLSKSDSLTWTLDKQ